MLRNRNIQDAKPMNSEQLESLLRYLSEERAHLYYGDDALEFNKYTGELQFTDEALNYIRREMEVLHLTFHNFGFRETDTIWDRIKNLFR